MTRNLLRKRHTFVNRASRIATMAVWMSLAAGVSGCATFTEDHFFAKPVLQDNEARYNFLRVRVHGSAKLSKTRYVAGYYDPRALDLFFNEIKSVPNAPGDIPKIFEQDITLPGTSEKLVPLKDKETGEFTMIFSTNATAVANTIGNFAEANVTADAITNLLNDREIEESIAGKGELPAVKTRAAATVSELDALLARLEQRRTAGQTVDAEMLRLLNAIARGLGGTGTLADVAEADAWFRARRVSSGRAP